MNAGESRTAQRLQNDFGIAGCAKVVSIFPELFTEGLVIVNLPIENNSQSPFLVPHRLTATCEIDNAEPPHRKPKSIFGPNAIVIGSAMHNRGVHLRQDLDAAFPRERP